MIPLTKFILTPIQPFHHHINNYNQHSGTELHALNAGCSVTFRQTSHMANLNLPVKMPSRNKNEPMGMGSIPHGPLCQTTLKFSTHAFPDP